MRIALIVDNPRRDLPGIALVAAELCRQGATCFLVPHNWARRELGALAPDFVLFSFLRYANIDLIQGLLDARVKIGILDSEGGVLRSLEHYVETVPFDLKLRSSIACVCSWGNKLADHLIQQQLFDSRQLTVTGAPRFDFYASQWHQAAIEMAPYVKQYSRPLVLINSSSPLSNPRFTTPDEEIEVWVNVGHDREDVIRWQGLMRRTMLDLANLTNTLAARFPSYTFVFRPHPFEKLETYRDLLDARDNTHLLNTGTVVGWLLKTDVLVQRCSSTAIEAGLAGIPSLSAAWVPAWTEIEATESVSVQCQTEEELVDQIERFVEDKAARPPSILDALDCVTRDWFGAMDGNAHKRVANRILEQAPDCANVSLRGARKVHYGLLPSVSLRSQLVLMLKMGLGIPADWSPRRWRTQSNDRWEKSGKRFDLEEVQFLLDAIQNNSPEESVSSTRLGATYARTRGDYRLTYTQGHSITIYPLTR